MEVKKKWKQGRCGTSGNRGIYFFTTLFDSISNDGLITQTFFIRNEIQSTCVFFPVFWTSPLKTVWLLSSRNEGAHQKQETPPPNIATCLSISFPLWPPRRINAIFLPLKCSFSHINYCLWRVAPSALKVSTNWDDECLQPLKRLLLDLCLLLKP